MKRHTDNKESLQLDEYAEKTKVTKREANPDTSLSLTGNAEGLNESIMPEMQSTEGDLVKEERPVKQEPASPSLNIMHLLDGTSSSPTSTFEDGSKLSHRTRMSSVSAAGEAAIHWLTDALDNHSNAYKSAEIRLLIFDYDGTLTPIIDNPAAALLPQASIYALNLLASHPKNSVWIVSGRNQYFLASQFEYSPNIGLAAEHGAFLRRPGISQWINLAQNLDMSWRKPVKQVFKGLCEIIPESRTEEKKAAIVWHYRANQEDGGVMAPACRELLAQRARRFGWTANVTAGKCVVEVRPDVINKGFIVSELVQKLKAASGHYPEFVFCVGDDYTDEGNLCVMGA